MTSALKALSLEPGDTGPAGKFSPDGRSQRFAGNTVLCHLDTSLPALTAMTRAVCQLRKRTEDEYLAWLPPSSYHVTLFDCSLDIRRNTQDWPAGLSLDAPLAACHDHIAKLLRSFKLGFEPPIRFVADESVPSPTLTTIPLRPIDGNEERRLRGLRDRLAAILGIHHANHESYNFHTTFGYYVQRFAPSELEAYHRDWAGAIAQFKQECPVVELGAPEFCLFEDMTSFRTQFHLENHP